MNWSTLDKFLCIRKTSELAQNDIIQELLITLIVLRRFIQTKQFLRKANISSFVNPSTPISANHEQWLIKQKSYHNNWKMNKITCMMWSPVKLISKSTQLERWIQRQNSVLLWISEFALITSFGQLFREDKKTEDKSVTWTLI